MAATAKLKLLLELGNKLFNNKLMQTKRKLNKTTDKMKGKLKQLKLSTVDAFSAMRNEVPLFGRAMDLLGNPYTLIAAGLLGVVTIFGKATIEAKKFNHEFLQIKQLNLDKNNKDLKTYKGLIMDSAFETGKSLTDTTKAYYDIQSALGFYGKDAETIFKSVAKFSTATGADLNDSINATSKAIKAFGLNANDTEMLLASNAKAVQVGITTFKELAKVQTEYGGAAYGAGQSVDSANKLFAVFTSIAKDSQQAATLTKTAFQGLTQAATVKGLKSIGVTIYDATGNLRSMENILVDVDKKFKKMTPRQIDELINKIGGSEGLRALLTKTKNGADDMFKTFEAFDSSKFNLDKALKNAKGDATVLGNYVKNKFNVIMAKLGSKILPLVLTVLVKLDDTLTFLYRNGKKIWSLIKNLTIAFIAFKTTNMLLNLQIGKLGGLFRMGLTGGIRASTRAMKSFSAAIKANAIGLIVSAIAVLVSKLTEAKDKLDEIRNAAIDKGKMFAENVANISNPTALNEGLLKTNDLSKRQAEKILSETKNNLNELYDLRSKLKVQLQSKGFNQDNIKNDNAELKSLNQLKNPDYLQKKRIDQLKFNISEHTKELTKGFNYQKIQSLIRKNKGILKKLGVKGDLLDDDASTTGTTNNENGNKTDYGVGKVTAAASSAKSIVIEKIVLNQGGINTTNTTLAHKTSEEIEEWFNEAMMRVIRNAELS